MALRRLTFVIKFNIDGVIPKPRGINLPSVFQLTTFIRWLMVLVIHALRNKEPTRKIKLSENIWFITEVLSADKNVTFLLPTFKLELSQCPFSSNGGILEDHQISPHDQLGTMLCKSCFQEKHQQLMQGQDLLTVIHGNDIDHC